MSLRFTMYAGVFGAICMITHYCHTPSANDKHLLLKSFSDASAKELAVEVSSSVYHLLHRICSSFFYFACDFGAVCWSLLRLLFVWVHFIWPFVYPPAIQGFRLFMRLKVLTRLYVIAALFAFLLIAYLYCIGLFSKIFNVSKKKSVQLLRFSLLLYPYIATLCMYITLVLACSSEFVQTTFDFTRRVFPVIGGLYVLMRYVHVPAVSIAIDFIKLKFLADNGTSIEEEELALLLLNARVPAINESLQFNRLEKNESSAGDDNNRGTTPLRSESLDRINGVDDERKKFNLNDFGNWVAKWQKQAICDICCVLDLWTLLGIFSILYLIPTGSWGYACIVALERYFQLLFFSFFIFTHDCQFITENIRHYIVWFIDYMFMQIFSFQLIRSSSSYNYRSSAFLSFAFSDTTSSSDMSSSAVQTRISLVDRITAIVTCAFASFGWQMPLWAKLCLRIIIYAPQLLLALLPSALLKLFLYYVMNIHPIFGALHCVENKKPFGSCVRWLLYFLCCCFYNKVCYWWATYIPFYQYIPFQLTFHLFCLTSMQIGLQMVSDTCTLKGLESEATARRLKLAKEAARGTLSNRNTRSGTIRRICNEASNGGSGGDGEEAIEMIHETPKNHLLTQIIPNTLNPQESNSNNNNTIKNRQNSDSIINKNCSSSILSNDDSTMQQQQKILEKYNDGGTSCLVDENNNCGGEIEADSFSSVSPFCSKQTSLI